MAGFGEPWDWTTDRNQRMESEYPELANTSADDVLGTDNYAVSQGHAPTQFSSTAMGLGAHSVVSKEAEDNSWWGAIKRAGSSILALDTPISERLGYKVPEGSGPADELANFALEESTRPSNIVLALGGLLTGGISTAGAATKVSLGAAARVAARAAAKNVAMGVGGRVAATGVEKVAEYAPEEIGPLAGFASAAAGLYATRGRSGLTRGAAALAAGGIGYASPELAGGIAGGVLTHKAIGGFSSWKEAANSIENRAATQAETQAAQLLEQAEASKQRMRDLAAAERRGETRIASDQMPETPMGQEWENNLLGQVAYKTGGDDVKALAIQVAKDVGEEIPADMAARARNAIASGEQNLLTNSAIELNNWRGVIGPDDKRIISPTARRRASPTFQNTPELKAADKAFKEGSIEGERRRVLTEAAQKETGNRATYVGETGEIRLGQNLKEARMIAEANADKGPIGKYLKGDDSALQAAADLRVSNSGTAYGYSAEGLAAQASATKAAKERLIADRAVYEAATGTPPAPVVKAATTPKITAADRRAALRTAPEVKPNEELLAQDASRTAEAADARMPVLAKYEAALRANKSGPLSPSERTVRFSDMQPADAVEAIRQEAPSSWRNISASTSHRDPKNLMGIDERGDVYLTSKGGGIVSKWDDATKKFVRRPVVTSDPNRYRPRIDWKVGVEFPATAVDDTGAQVAAQADVARFAAEDAARAAPPPAQVAAQAKAAAPAASKPNYQDIPKGAEPAGRIVEPVPDVNPHLAKMRTKPGEPGYAKALQRAESRWKAQQTIRAAAAPAVEPPIARVETPVAAPAAAQQVNTPAAGGGGEAPPPPRDTATGSTPEFEGTPQSSRSFPTWEDSATHNRISAELAPVIEERLGQAAKTTALKTSENNKIKDIANRQAEKVREAAISEGKTESQANALYREEWRKAYSGERTKSKLDLPLTISDLTDAQIRDSFTRVQREVPGDTYLINKIFEATRALDAITGKTQGAKKSELESLKFWVNLMSPEEESRYLENQFRNYGGFNSKNAKLLVTQEKLLKAKPAFGADDIADGVPAGSAGRGAANEADAPRQTGEPTARSVDESINRPIDELTGEPVAEPTVAPNGQTMDGAGSTAGEAEIPGATGGGGKGRGKGAGKDGDGAEPVDPEEFDLGKTWAKNAQELNDERNVNDLTTGFGLWANFKALLSLPRSLKSMADLSGGGRQAAPYVYSHPNQGIKAFKKQMQAWGSEEGYLASNAELANKPYAAVRDQVVASSLVEQPLMNGEKTLVAQFAMVVPGLRRSERAYATFLNVLRDSAFEMMFKKSGLTLEELASKENIPRVKAWGDLVNAATGHGDIGTLLNTSVAGNPILWAPNFLYSRVKLPWLAFKNLGKLKSQPELATEGAKQLVTFVGVNSALLYGINASGLASVEVDPRSSDFGQIRIGNSRIDPWAGYRPIANLIARLQSGQTKSTTTGDISDPTNLKIVQDFLRNKMEPLSGEILNQILGSNSIGEPTVADTNMAIRLVAPLFLESMVRAINVGGPSVTPSENFSDQIASFGRNVTSPGGLKAAALTLPGVLGIGTATYEPLIKKMDRATLDKMSPQERNNFQTGEQRGLANLTPAEQQKVIPAIAFRRMYETMPSATQELSNYGSFSGFKRDKIREYAEYYMGIGMSKANSVLRAEQQFQNSGYQQIYQKHVNYLKYQWSEANPGTLAEEIEETYTINPRDRTFRPNATQRAMAEPYLQKR